MAEVEMSNRREPMTRHKEEQFNEPWVKEDVRFDECMSEPYEFSLSHDQIMKIENATSFYLYHENDFVPAPSWSLIGVKFAVLFAMGAGQITFRYEKDNFIVVTNEMSNETFKFVTEKFKLERF
jgi:roadblock/LC7 domain-containing protein